MPLLRVQPARGRNDRIACPPQFRPDRHSGDVRTEFSKIHPVQNCPDPVLPPTASEARRDRVRVADDPVWKPGEDSIRVPHPRFQEIPAMPHHRNASQTASRGDVEVRAGGVGMEQGASRDPAARQ